MERLIAVPLSDLRLVVKAAAQTVPLTDRQVTDAIDRLGDLLLMDELKLKLNS